MFSWLKQSSGTKRFQVLVTIVAIAAIILRQLGISFDAYFSNTFNRIIGNLLLDTTTIVLFIIFALVWILPLAKRINSLKGRFQNVNYTTWLKLLVSIGALIFILVHIIWPGITVDTITIALLIIVALPWLTSLIESAKLPGGWEIKFRDIQAAGNKVTSGSLETVEETPLPQPSFLSVAEQDPNLALVGLRIEIETRVRRLALLYNIPEQRSLMRMTQMLLKQEVIDREFVAGLEELIYAGNSAAHGARVEPQVAQWAIDYGPKVLAALDARLEEDGTSEEEA